MIGKNFYDDALFSIILVISFRFIFMKIKSSHACVSTCDARTICHRNAERLIKAPKSRISALRSLESEGLRAAGNKLKFWSRQGAQRWRTSEHEHEHEHEREHARRFHFIFVSPEFRARTRAHATTFHAYNGRIFPRPREREIFGTLLIGRVEPSLGYVVLTEVYPRRTLKGPETACFRTLSAALHSEYWID